MNRLGRHVVLKSCPAQTAVKGNMNSKVCPDEKKVGIFRMLSDDIDWFIRKIRGNGSPGFSVVSRFVKKGPEVVLPETSIRNISHTWLIIRGSHPAHPVARISFYIFIEFGPVFTTISGYPDIAIIGPNPEQAFHQR